MSKRQYILFDENLHDIFHIATTDLSFNHLKGGERAKYMAAQVTLT